MDALERAAIEDAQADEKMSVDDASSAAAASAQPERKKRYADAFAKDDSAFPLCIVWLVKDHIEYDSEDFAKKMGYTDTKQHQEASSTSRENFYKSWAPNFHSQSASHPMEAMKYRPANFLHWKMHFNWDMSGGPTDTAIGCSTEQLAKAPRCRDHELKNMKDINQAD
jgi:hypothetical protein